MRTEIVIPFAFDTAPIEKLLEEQGEAEVMRILSEKVDSAVGRSGLRGMRYRVPDMAA